MIGVSITDEAQETANVIEMELLKSLADKLPQTQNSHLVLAARNDQKSLIGGLTASTSYGWLLIKTLWVDQECRRQRVGMLLVDVAENRARAADCHAAWLDTSNPESMLFYAELGYEIFGELTNSPGQLPETHHRWFMRKSLTSPELSQAPMRCLFVSQ